MHTYIHISYRSIYASNIAHRFPYYKTVEKILPTTNLHSLHTRTFIPTIFLHILYLYIYSMNIYAYIYIDLYIYTNSKTSLIRPSMGTNLNGPFREVFGLRR